MPGRGGSAQGCVGLRVRAWKGSKMSRVTLFLLVLCASVTVAAELQHVKVGGLLRLRGRYWTSTYYTTSGGAAVDRYVFATPARALGAWDFASRYDFDDRGPDLSFVEQKSQIYAEADFTHHVSARIALEAFEVWGRDFRSDYVTGADSRAVSNNDVEVLHAYVDADRLGDQPLRLRVGRQPLKFGKGWLVSDVISATLSLSFDAVRLTYTPGDFTVDAWFAKLAETSPIEADGDVDFYGVYGTYTGWEPADLSAYVLWVRDARARQDTQFGLLAERIEDFVGLDDYDTKQLITLGLRANGVTRGFTYDLELAYQTGDADAAGFLFRQYIYGDNDARYDSWAADLEVGYSFDSVRWQPRPYIGGAYFDGEDNRDVTFLEWLNPFRGGPDALPFWEALSPWPGPEASMGFNRLFSGTAYNSILDIQQDLSNFYQLRGGVDLNFTEKISGNIEAAYYGVVDPADLPPSFSIARREVNYLAALPFITFKADEELGTIMKASLKYAYSEDFWVRIGVEHLFTGDGLEEGSFLHRNGLQFSGGSGDDDANYFFVDTRIAF